MVENLQSLCSDVDDDFGWQLRQTLQSEPRLMLLATATSRFRGLDDANRPFFELFRIVELEPLRYGCLPAPLEHGQRRQADESRDQAPSDSDRRQPPPAGHRRHVCTASIAAPAPGRTGDAGRRPHRVLPQPSGGPCQDRAPRLSRGDRPLAIVERPRDRGASSHGHSHRIGADRAAGRPGRSCRGRNGQEAEVRRRGTSLQHLLQAATRTRRGRAGAQPHPVHDGVLPQRRIGRDGWHVACGGFAIAAHSRGTRTGIGRQRHTGPPAGGCQGADQQGRHAP